MLSLTKPSQYWNWPLWFCFSKALSMWLSTNAGADLEDQLLEVVERVRRKDKQPRFRGRAQFSGPQQQPTVSTCIWRAGAKCKNHFLDHYRIFSTCSQLACHSPLQWIQSIFMGHGGQTGLVYGRERSVFSATPGRVPYAGVLQL